jgi:outer membrane murein-binding lipoprotein Lpp
MNGKSLLKRKSILRRKFHEANNKPRREMRTLLHPFGRHLLLLAVPVSLLSLAGCGNRADISEGKTYIQELENRDVNAMQQAIKQAQEARSGDETGGSSREARKAAIERFRANYESADGLNDRNSCGYAN